MHIPIPITKAIKVSTLKFSLVRLVSLTGEPYSPFRMRVELALHPRLHRSLQQLYVSDICTNSVRSNARA